MAYPKGKKTQPSTIVGNQSLTDMFGITIDLSGFVVLPISGEAKYSGDKTPPVMVINVSGTGITPSDFANLPYGSIIFDVVASGKIYFKVAASGTSTWKYGAIAT